MCLAMVDKRYKKNTVIREAWKVVFSTSMSGETIFKYRSYAGEVKRGVWLKANTSPTIGLSNPPWPRDSRGDWRSDPAHADRRGYNAGFHVFATEDLARAYEAPFNNSFYKVVRVFVRGIRTVGREYVGRVTVAPIGPVFVAEEMFIP